MPKVDCGFQSDSNATGKDLLEFRGPTLQVLIGFDPTYRLAASGSPLLPQARYPALVDTGASECCVDSVLAKALKLPVVDQEDRSGAHGKHKLDIHLAQIYVPELAWVMVGKFAGVHLVAGGQPHCALIGRTFLRSFTMIYEGETGAVTISRA